MKRKIQVLSLLLLILSTICFGQNNIDIIPQPLSVKLNNNTTFKYDNNTKIICNVDSKEYSVAVYLHSQLDSYNPCL